MMPLRAIAASLWALIRLCTTRRHLGQGRDSVWLHRASRLTAACVSDKSSARPRLHAGRVVRVDPVAVFARHHVLDPRLIIEIPADRGFDTSLESLCRTPAKFALDITCINRIAAIMARTTLHVGDLVLVRYARLRLELVEQVADRSCVDVYNLSAGALNESSTKSTRSQ